jgi:serine/threonine protein phosphatase 1
MNPSPAGQTQMLSIFKRRLKPAQTILALDQPAVIYAIGDIHGCLDKLRSLEAKIIADSQQIGGDKLIITLGDYIDRGPNSAQVLNWLGRDIAGLKRICLRGNHEAMFLEAFARPQACDDWLAFGGRQTLVSYGIDPDSFIAMGARARGQVLESLVPPRHLDLLRDCRSLVTIGEFVFVHAGIRPGVPLERQRDEDLLWIREPFLSSPHGLSMRVVHGHTKGAQPVLTEHRICVDTGAYEGGPLTALRILASGELSFMTS